MRRQRSSGELITARIGGRTDRRVRVRMPGGTLEVVWRDDGEVLLTGAAEVVYRGEWLLGGAVTG